MAQYQQVHTLHRMMRRYHLGDFASSLSSLNSSLLAYWRMDETVGFVRADAYGNVSLTDTNSQVTSGAGLIANAAHVASGGPTTLGHADNSILRFNSSKTFSFWYKPESPGTNTGILSKFVSGADYLLWNDVGGNTTWQVKDGGGTTRSLQVLAGHAANGSFHHFVVGFDNANNQIFSYYDNGAKVTAACTGTTSSSDIFYIGTYFDKTFNSVGFYDEVALFDHALSASEVNFLFNAGAGRTIPF